MKQVFFGYFWWFLRSGAQIKKRNRRFSKFESLVISMHYITLYVIDIHNNRCLEPFLPLWTDGLHATVHMLTNGDCKVWAQLEFELGKPVEIFPYPFPFRRSQLQGKAGRHPGHHQLSACTRPSWKNGEPPLSSLSTRVYSDRALKNVRCSSGLRLIWAHLQSTKMNFDILEWTKMTTLTTLTTWLNKQNRPQIDPCQPKKICRPKMIVWSGATFSL